MSIHLFLHTKKHIHTRFIFLVNICKLLNYTSIQFSSWENSTYCPFSIIDQKPVLNKNFPM